MKRLWQKGGAQALRQAETTQPDVILLDIMFARGDDVIRFTAKIIQDGVEASGCRDGFIGHVGGDDFIFLVGSNTIRRFDQGIRGFYEPDHLQARGIFSRNRLGKRTKHPIMSISLAAVDLSSCGFEQYLEVNDACVEIKHKAKAKRGSCFCMDQRRG